MKPFVGTINERHEHHGKWELTPWEPEADLVAVANHDFSQLSAPILVACRDQEQLEEFVFREGLMCSEVRRLKPGRYNPSGYPQNKILILLPEWHDDFKTWELVNRWVNIEDRYTVQLTSPRPVCKKPLNPVHLVLIGALVWLLVLWLIFR